MVAFARRMNPPANEIPMSVAISALLARTQDVAIALVGAQAYTFGLRFDLVIRLRQEPRGERPVSSCPADHCCCRQRARNSLMEGDSADDRHGDDQPRSFRDSFGPPVQAVIA
jgi:hypothetical protein